MLSFYQIRLVSVSLAGAIRESTQRRLDISGAPLVFFEVHDEAARSLNAELARMAQRWAQDGGYDYLVPVVAKRLGAMYGGFIDGIAGSLTLQAEPVRDRTQAMGFALCAASLRSGSDRGGLHLPARILPRTGDLAPLLDRTLHLDPSECISAPAVDPSRTRIHQAAIA